jgi:hypothetical protein
MHYAMNTYGEQRCIARTFLASALDGYCRFNSGERPLVPTGQVAGCALELVWMLWRSKKSLALTGNQTPAVQPVAIPN